MRLMSKLIVSAALTGLCTSVCAQKINNPTHIPNRFKNKINNVRLKGLTEKYVVENRVNELAGEATETPKPDLFFGRTVLEGDGCRIDIGNNTNSGSGIGGVSEVIIAGDIINLCK